MIPGQRHSPEGDHSTSLPARVPLATLPTPLIRARRLERRLKSAPIYIKRDDLTGFAAAGNKARKLEFLMADALARGCDSVVTGGGPGSNHCQATAAAARVLGLSCRLVMYGQEDPHRANLALSRAFGAEVFFTGTSDRSSVDRAIDAEARRLRAEGREPYAIPRGGASPLGAVGFAHAVGELSEQLDQEDIRPESVVVATGSCGTQAGMVAGTVGGEHRWRVIGAAVSRPPDECRERVLELSRGCARLLRLPSPGMEHVEVRDARGPGYDIPSTEGRAASDLMSNTEGILLDPVYTAKAFSVALGIIAASAGPVVFWHTGGLAVAIEEAMGMES